MGGGKRHNLHQQQETLTSFLKKQITIQIFCFILSLSNLSNIIMVTLSCLAILMWCHASVCFGWPQLLTSGGSSRLSNRWLSWLFSDMGYNLKGFLERSVCALHLLSTWRGRNVSTLNGGACLKKKTWSYSIFLYISHFTFPQKSGFDFTLVLLKDVKRCAPFPNLSLPDSNLKMDWKHFWIQPILPLRFC